MSKIDGRKAEIINVGRRFTTYEEFADHHGYPDAAVPFDHNDARTKPIEGDIVTLLTSGNHLSGMYGTDTLWIVEMANGERFIFNEKGLRILEGKSGVTVIADEKLGGVEREYTEVKRKARVGERIKIVSNHMCHSIPNGTEGVMGRGDTMRHDFVTLFVGNDTDIDGERDYVVLEPITSAPTVAPTPPQSDDIQRTLDGLTEAIVNLTRRVTELETVARPEKCEVIASGTVKGGLPSFITRDYAVERAKRDIDVLKVTHHPTLLQYYVARNLTWQPECDAEFIVNSDKRTVVCLLRKRNYNGKGEIQSRGFAKCGPDDVFNVHIGRAISLRRALGLGVPAEYVRTPQPTGVRVGDIVQITGHDSNPRQYYDIGDTGVVRTVGRDDVRIYGIKTKVESRSQHNYFQQVQPVDFLIIDDSREEVGA